MAKRELSARFSKRWASARGEELDMLRVTTSALPEQTQVVLLRSTAALI